MALPTLYYYATGDTYDIDIVDFNNRAVSAALKNAKRQSKVAEVHSQIFLAAWELRLLTVINLKKHKYQLQSKPEVQVQSNSLQQVLKKNRSKFISRRKKDYVL